MKEECLILTCDRCGNQVVLKKINENGITGALLYENKPEGWKSCYRDLFRSDDLKHLCPKCTKKLEAILACFWTRAEEIGSECVTDESANLPERSETEETDQDPDDGKPWSFDQMSRYR